MHSIAGRLLITGASGQLGSYLLKELQGRGRVVGWSQRPNVELFGFSCRQVDLNDVDRVVQAFHEADPDVVIHAAAMSRVAQCAKEPAVARQVNCTATRLLAELAQRHNARLVYTSTDLVFNGRSGNYRETDPPEPLSVYGRSKAMAEPAVLHHANQLVLRLSLLFGPPLNGCPSFFQQQVDALQHRAEMRLFTDEWRTPLSLLSAARGVLVAANSRATGILHLAGPERMTRWEMGQRLAAFYGLSSEFLVPIHQSDLVSKEPRPRDTSLNADRWLGTFSDQKPLGFEQALEAMCPQIDP